MPPRKKLKTIVKVQLPAGAATPVATREWARVGGEIERVAAAVGPKVVQISTQSLKVAGQGDEQPIVQGESEAGKTVARGS